MTNKRMKGCAVLALTGILAAAFGLNPVNAAVGRMKAGELLAQFKAEQVPNSGVVVEVGVVGSGLLNRLCGPSGIWLEEDGTFLMTDRNGKAVWKVKDAASTVLAGKVTEQNLWGEPTGGYADGIYEEAVFGEPWAIVPYMGGYAVSDPVNHVIRFLKDGRVRTIAGNGRVGFADGDTTTLSVMLNTPTGLAVDDYGHLFIADTGNGAVRRLDETGKVITCTKECGEPTGLYYRDGTLYIADSGNDRICMMAGVSSKSVSGGMKILTGRIAGPGEEAECRDGSVEEARFSNPQGVIAADDGAVYVADTGNGAVRRVKDGEVTTLLKLDSQKPGLYPVSPTGLALDDDGLYVTDPFTKTILYLPLK